MHKLFVELGLSMSKNIRTQLKNKETSSRQYALVFKPIISPPHNTFA